MSRWVRSLAIVSALVGTTSSAQPVTVTQISPLPDSAVSTLTEISVTFDQQVSGVKASDLTVNNQPAVFVSATAGTNRLVFSFAQPLPGEVAVAWDELQNITGISGLPFTPSPGASTWSYTLLDLAAPQVLQHLPVAGAQVSRLAQAEVVFNEPVSGVNAADLLVNGQPAQSVTGSAAGPYVFLFNPVAAGPVQFSWASNHGITDVAETLNAFGGGDWAVTVDPAVALGDVVINEFLAGNVVGLFDEEASREDWIEIWNRGSNTVNLLGWSLTDDARFPGLWVFPETNLAPGEYLVVFASGKDRRVPGARLHTNFKLDLFGEYLALFNAESPRVAVTEFAAGFPEQRNDYSHGVDSSNAWRYFTPPTPGAPNTAGSFSGIAPEPHFSVSRGWFDAPFNLVLTSPLEGASVRYTRDGSEPTFSTGLVYTGPLQITNTTTLRAAVFGPGYLPSRTKTHTYLFLDQVVAQPNNPAGFPSDWGYRPGWGFPNDLVPADYVMDMDPLRVDPLNAGSAIDPQKLQRLQDGMRELPVLSVVMRSQDMFGPSGIYDAANVMTKFFPDKACSVEMILPDGSTAFAETCGIRIHGNASREPNKNPKHGFKLKFQNEFGSSRLSYPVFPDSPVKEFDDLILRADFGVSWRHWSDVLGEINGSLQRTRAVRFRDAWMKESARDMGVLAGHNRFCHLFINGVYWGTYDISEQPKGTFAAGLLGGAGEDYDVYEQGTGTSGYVEGTPPGGTPATYNAFQKMLALPTASTSSTYDAYKQYLDVTGYIDYVLLHFFVGHRDWGTLKNWYAVRRRAGGNFSSEGLFQYVPWDGECILLNADGSDNRVPDSGATSDSSTASGLHAKLKGSAQYRLDFADRVHKHMIAPGGALTAEANIRRWLGWSNILDKPIVAESVRWGDYRRDVHRYLNGSYQLYTRENQWMAENSRVVESYFPGRTADILGWLRTAGLYPLIDAPELHQGSTAGPLVAGGAVPPGFALALRNPGAGTIYYTTNGADPRVYHAGSVASAAHAYSTPLVLNASMTVKARVLNGASWSALNEAAFTVGEIRVPLQITEIMYNPPGGNAYEFLELQNIGSLPLDAGGFKFEGITHHFPDGTVLQPGAIVLLANGSNPSLFAARYPGVPVSGYFSGNLDNAGERLAVLDRNGRVILSMHYDDEAGWPTSPDGSGPSLEIINPREDPNVPANWRASAEPNGFPGLRSAAQAPAVVILNEVMADNRSAVANEGAFPDWIELRNSGAAQTNIGGWSLTDGGNARKFVFPPNTIVPAGGYLVVWCDTASGAPGLHSGFALGRAGETISLYDASTNRIDAVSYGLQVADLTIGRVEGVWRLTAPTPSNPNAPAPLASPASLAINEWLATPAAGSSWIELFNRSAALPLELRGLHLETTNALTQIRSLSYLPPGGFLQLFIDSLPGPDHLECPLPASGTITLYNELGGELERVSYAPQGSGVSAGRLPDGSASFSAFPGTASPGASNYVVQWTGPVLNELLARNSRAEVAPWGRFSDWIEIYNPSNGLANVSGMGLGRSADASERWIIPSGTTVPALGYRRIWCDDSAAASTAVSPALNSGFSLDGDGGEVVLFNGAGQQVDRVKYGFQVADQTIGRSGGSWTLLSTRTPAAANSPAASLGNVGALRINEWMAAPLSGDDWFELFNPNNLPVKLSDLYLTDDPSSTGVTKFQIGPLSFLGARKWLRWDASGDPGQGGSHVNFSLDKLGETIRLYGSNVVLIDAVDFGIQGDGVSQGRLTDGATNIVSFPVSATPGEPNYLPLANVVINEVLTHTDAPLEDAIELQNTSAQPADVSGWYLSDSSGDLKRYRIPSGTVIPPGGFKVFYQFQFGPAGDGDAPPLFSFNGAHGDAAWLSEATAAGELTGHRTGVSFGAAENGVSFGRHQTSVGVDFVALNQRSFGADTPSTSSQFRTGTGATNAYPKVGPVVISEIHYHPPDSEDPGGTGEFVELHNYSASSVPLFDPVRPTNAWRLANGISFNLPSGTAIPAGGYLVVVPFNPEGDAAALTAFRNLYGTNATVIGPFSGRLDNAEETIEVWRPDTPQGASDPDAGFVPYILVERVAYADRAPWPVEADGFGFSLHRAVASDYGNEPLNWIAAPPSVGSGVPPAPSILAQPTNRITYAGETVVFSVSASSVTPLKHQWFKDGSTVPNATNAVLTFVANPGNAGSYRAGVSNAVGGVLSAPAELTVIPRPNGTVSLANGSLSLSFPVLLNRRYQVQYTTSLSHPAWLPLGEVVVPQQSPITFIEPVLQQQHHRFYRLLILP